MVFAKIMENSFVLTNLKAYKKKFYKVFFFFFCLNDISNVKIQKKLGQSGRKLSSQKSKCKRGYWDRKRLEFI